MENSGATVIFDAKTAEAIEEGKNRVTLLQSEEARLRKLIGVLQSDISKLEAAISDKQGLDEELVGTIDVSRSRLKELQEEILYKEAKFNALREESEKITKEIEVTTAEITERERALTLKEEVLAAKEEALNLSWSELNTAKEELETKKTKLHQVLQSL